MKTNFIKNTVLLLSLMATTNAMVPDQMESHNYAPIGVISTPKLRKQGDLNEDRWNVVSTRNKELFVGVFDGHGNGLRNESKQHIGHAPGAVAQHIAQNLCTTITAQNDYPQDLHSAIIDGVFFLDRTFMHPLYKCQGSTGVFAFIRNDTITVANLGDSRCVIYNSEGNPLFSTRDHKIDGRLEQKRIKNEGGTITNDKRNNHRLEGVLAMSRSFGDYGHGERINNLTVETNTIDEYKRTFVGRKLSGLSNMPDITTLPRANSHFIILGSDGLWDMISNEDLGEIVVEKLMENNALTMQQLAAKIVTELIGNIKPNDDLTIMIINLLG